MSRRAKRFLWVGIAATLGVVAVLIVLATVPVNSSSRSYSLTNPCAGTDNVGPNCGERLEFNSSWESRVTIAWSSPPQPQTVITPCFLATNGSATLVGSTGSYTFISLGGTTACSFGGVAGEPTQVTVTIVRPIL
ncbi:MAG: hypothetical protein L3K16_00230 [Thermoplasmata archaeon]|nr:hypothetical protein [Thermoplasmata archaeon]